MNVKIGRSFTYRNSLVAGDVCRRFIRLMFGLGDTISGRAGRTSLRQRRRVAGVEGRTLLHSGCFYLKYSMRCLGLQQ